MHTSIIPHRWYDRIPARLKISFKRWSGWITGSGCWQEIISAEPRAHSSSDQTIAASASKLTDHGITGLRPAWCLGIQPDRVLLQQLTRQYGDQLQLVSIITRSELLIDDQELARQWPGCDRWLYALYDHSVCSPRDGINQSLYAFQQQLAQIHQLWQASTKPVFYCHCMAGRGRSFLFLLAWMLYYYIPEHPELADPNLSQLANFIQQRRPAAFGLQKLEGEQTGFAGLLALDWLVQKPLIWWQQRDSARLQNDLQCAGLALQATLDTTFRTASDLAAQQQQVGQLWQRAQQLAITRPLLELLLWTPPWHHLPLLIGAKQDHVASLTLLRQKAWHRLSRTAQANWPRWQWWWLTA